MSSKKKPITAKKITIKPPKKAAVVVLKPKKKDRFPAPKPVIKKQAEAPPASAPSELPPIDKPLLVRRASHLRLHLLAFRKRIGQVTPESQPWIKIGVRHLDSAIEHIKEFPSLAPYGGDYTIGACSESKKSACGLAKALFEDVIDLLDRTHSATDRDENDKFYDEADLILDTVSLDLERFQSDDDMEDKPVEAASVAAQE